MHGCLARGGLAAAAVVALGLALPAGSPAAVVRGGAASADITAPVGTPMFAYTARSYIFSPDLNATQERALQLIADPDTGLYAKTFEPSVGIHTRVLARAIVLERGGAKYALAQADLGGLPYALTQEVARRVAGTGISEDHILLSATHTHSSTGPIWGLDNMGYGLVGGDAFDPRVFELTVRGIAAAIRRADERLRPVRIGVGTAELHDASRNREYDVYLRDHDIAADPAAQRADSINPTVTVVRVDRRDGTPMAVWSNFAIHGTSFGDGNLLFSGDNPGVAERITEQTIARDGARGSRRPAVVDVWTNGTEGDTAPDGDTHTVQGQAIDYVPSDAAKAYLAGARTAAGILSAWADAGRHMVDDPGIGARRMFFSFDGTSYGGPGGKSEPVGPFPVLGLGVIQEKRPSLTNPGQEEPNCAPVDDLAGPGQGEKMPLIGGPGIAPNTVPISFWRIGRLGIAAYPAEITKQMGQRIRTSLRQSSAGALDRVIIAGLTNAYLSYTATPEEYGACTYEGSFTLMGREEGYAWLAGGTALERSLLRGTAAPAGAPEPPQLSFGTTASTPPRATPQAGTALSQPAGVARYGRAVFRWTGGDPQVDAPRGIPFVALQRQTGSGWRTVATDDSYLDTTQRAAGDVWTETFQFDGCFPTGSYRFHVTGRAVRSFGAPPVAYALGSRPFTVVPLKIAAGSATVATGVASVRPLYPDPGPGALVALPRLVRGADVVLTLSDGTTVPAADPDGDGVYTAGVGDARVTGVSVADACGNAA